MNLLPIHVQEISELITGRVLTDAALSRFTSFRIGGPADLLVEPNGVEELAALLRYVHTMRLPNIVLGAGTNVLFRDSGFRGVVIRTAGIGGFSVQQNSSDTARLTAAAGVPLPSVVSRAARQGWKGLEALWGIPGTFGGAIATNAGAGGTSLGDVLSEVTVMNVLGERIVIQKENLRFGYRWMSLPQATTVIEGVLQLPRGDKKAIEADLERASVWRRSSQPLDRPSSGCIFKNPAPDNPAGAIIDRLGLKGTTVGDAQVSEVHANFIINCGKATAADVLALIDLVRERVRAEEGTDLELEICVIKEQPPDV
jgi:UDP-N-acetylmuramate dehydrogenase